MTGMFEHTLDAKGRVFVPAKLRERLGASFHVAIGASKEPDGEVCRYLALYPEDVWQELEEKINALPAAQAAQADVLMAYAAPCEMDSQCRILIPPILRAYAQLGKEVVITGSGNKAKLWDRSVWEQRSAPKLDPGMVAEMFERLGL